MRVSAITPTRPPIDRKPRFMMSVRYDKFAVVNGDTGERTEFTDSVAAWKFKQAMERV